MADIAGWSISDDPANPTKYVFPALTTIAAEDELRILFPDRMSQYGTQEDGSWTFPDSSLISNWVQEDYGISKEGALQEVLNAQRQAEISP